MKTPMGRIIALEVGCFGCMTIAKIKQEIQDKEGIPSEHQQLSFNEMPLNNEKSLSEYNIQKDSTLATTQGGKWLPMTLILKLSYKLDKC